MIQQVGSPTAPFHTGYVYSERRRNLELDDALTGNEWQVLPQSLHESLDGVDQIVILDPLSFPFEALRNRDWWLPITVAWPRSVSGEVAFDLLAGPLLSRLTFFDSVVVQDDSAWEDLRLTYHFAGSQRKRTRGEEPRSWVASTLHSGSVAARAFSEVAARRDSPLDPWTLRCAETKRSHVLEVQALLPVLREAERVQPAGRRPRVAHIGVGVGRLTSALAGYHYHGFSRGPAATAQAQLNFPELDIRSLGPSNIMALPTEQIDLAIATHELSRLATDQRRSLISAMWDALRIGGRFVVLDSFVPKWDQRSVAADQLIADLLEAANYELVLTDVTSLRSPDSATRDLGLITMTKIGVPTRW